LQDLGFVCSSNVEVLSEILVNSSCPSSEQSVGHALAMMASTRTGLLAASIPPGLCQLEDGSSQDSAFVNSWNFANFVQAIKTKMPDLNWVEVVRFLDSRFLDGIDSLGLESILSVFGLASTENFPVHHFFGRWRQSKCQLQVMKAVLSRPELVLNLLMRGSRQVPSSDSIWGSVDFVETLLRLSDIEGYDEVLPMFSSGVSDFPDVLLLSLAKSQPCWGSLYRDIVSNLLDRLFRIPSSDSSGTIHDLWICNKAILIQGLVELYSQHAHPDTVRHISSIIQDIGSDALLEVLATKQNYFFVFDLAVSAAQNHSIPFANWMSRSVADGGDEFVLQCVNFLRERFYGGGNQEVVYGLPADIASTMLHSLQGCKSAVACVEIRKLAKDAQGRLLGGAPPMQNMPMVNPPASVGISGTVNASGPQVAGDVQDGGSQQAVQQQQQGQTLFPPDIEEEANSHFQKIYTSEMQIEGVIQMLKGFKLSQNQREQEVFACMIHNLFDEYRFFPRCVFNPPFSDISKS
jgi:CCR4-NOT transcription complex subunit 1